MGGGFTLPCIQAQVIGLWVGAHLLPSGLTLILCTLATCSCYKCLMVEMFAVWPKIMLHVHCVYGSLFIIDCVFITPLQTSQPFPPTVMS